MRIGRKRGVLTAVTMVLVILAIAGTVLAASNYGTKDDPLVSLSYVTDVLTPELLRQIGGEVDTAVSGLQDAIASIPSSPAFELITLNAGETWLGAAGAEIILRNGEAVCHSENTGLLNITSGEVLEQGGALAENNLYIGIVDGDGITAVSETAQLLVRGNPVPAG